MTRQRTRRVHVVVGVSALLVTAALLALTMSDSLTYYREPHELDGRASDNRVRVGGQVVDGSLVRRGGVTEFTLTDGVAHVDVRYAGRPAGIFREGLGAVVEGTYNGVLIEADSVMTKHSNEYTAPDRPPSTSP